MEGLILFAGIYQMHAVLNLQIIHEKQKIDKIILLLLKRKFKKIVNLSVRNTKKMYVVSAHMNGGDNLRG